MYSIFAALMEQRGVNITTIARETGISASTFTDWRAGRYTPKADKMQKIAEYFQVSVDYLMTGKDREKESTSGAKYYFSDETARAAQEIFENKDLRILFDAARDAKPEDLKMAADMLKRFKGTNNEG